MSFLEDEQGISAEVFKLALAIIVVAAILSIMASMLFSVRESGTESVNSTAQALEDFSERIKERVADF
jgi:hypothetical protein